MGVKKKSLECDPRISRLIPWKGIVSVRGGRIKKRVCCQTAGVLIDLTSC